MEELMRLNALVRIWRQMDRELDVIEQDPTRLDEYREKTKDFVELSSEIMRLSPDTLNKLMEDNPVIYSKGGK